jgi:hypothetical protein
MLSCHDPIRGLICVRPLAAFGPMAPFDPSFLVPTGVRTALASRRPTTNVQDAWRSCAMALLSRRGPRRGLASSMHSKPLATDSGAPGPVAKSIAVARRRHGKGCRRMRSGACPDRCRRCVARIQDWQCTVHGRTTFCGPAMAVGHGDAQRYPERAASEGSGTRDGKPSRASMSLNRKRKDAAVGLAIRRRRLGAQRVQRKSLCRCRLQSASRSIQHGKPL